MQKKTVRMIVGLGVGAIAAAAEKQWPEGSPHVQMGFYSALCLAPLLFAFWSHWRRADYWKGFILAVLVHAAILYFARSMFPLKFGLVLLPVAFIEVALLLIIVLKSVGNEANLYH